jgi:hypothetical protein
MKMHTVYDGQGKIVSAGVPLPPAYDFRGPRFGPQAGTGQHAAELDVPEEHAHLAFHELAERLHVDVKAKPHKLVSKGD